MCIDCDIINYLSNKLGISSWGSTWTLTKNLDCKDCGYIWANEKQNLILKYGYEETAADINCQIIKIKNLGAKYIHIVKTRRELKFYLDITPIRQLLDEQKRLEQIKEENRLRAIDLVPFEPKPSEFKKVLNYRNNHSRVNVKAITTLEKLYRYYYLGCILDWKLLKDQIWDAVDYNDRDILRAMDLQLDIIKDLQI